MQQADALEGELEVEGVCLTCSFTEHPRTLGHTATNDSDNKITPLEDTVKVFLFLCESFHLGLAEGQGGQVHGGVTLHTPLLPL